MRGENDVLSIDPITDSVCEGDAVGRGVGTVPRGGEGYIIGSDKVGVCSTHKEYWRRRRIRCGRRTKFLAEFTKGPGPAPAEGARAPLHVKEREVRSAIFVLK